MSLFRTTGKSSKELIIDAKLLELNECLGKGEFYRKKYSVEVLYKIASSPLIKVLSGL
jgi:hypothetical protein